jgi:hypothetical protein
MTKERTMDELFKLMGATNIKGEAFKNLTLTEAATRVFKAQKILIAMYNRIPVKDMPERLGLSPHDVEEISSLLFKDQSFLFAVSHEVFTELVEMVKAIEKSLTSDD